jgi:cell division protein FtsN
VFRATRALPILCALLAGCAAAPEPAQAPAPRALTPDSAALLAEAIRQARPAFGTHGEALRSGVYEAARAEARPQPTVPPVRRPVRAETTPHSGVYVIQIGAFRGAGDAEAAARAAGRAFPELGTRVEHAGDVYRVALAAWSDRDDATRSLVGVRRLYPDAWVRRAAP